MIRITGSILYYNINPSRESAERKYVLLNFKIEQIKTQKVGIIEAPDLVLENEQDALDLIAEVSSFGARAIILPAANLSREFFDLKTGLAGDILQKFSNYQVKLAIIGSFDHYQSRNLAAFIRESNRGNLIYFVPDKATAIQYLFP